MRAEQTDGRSGECIEENSPQSNSQFGIVSNDEMLIRYIYLDNYLDSNGKLAASTMQIRDFMEPSRNGVSVSRLHHMRNEDVCSQINLIESKRDHPIYGIAIANASRIRGLRTQQGRRVFCVIDDATPTNPAHALIRLEDRENARKSSVRKYRIKLLQLFEFRPRRKLLKSLGSLPESS